MSNDFHKNPDGRMAREISDEKELAELLKQTKKVFVCGFGITITLNDKREIEVIYPYGDESFSIELVLPKDAIVLNKTLNKKKGEHHGRRKNIHRL